MKYNRLVEHLNTKSCKNKTYRRYNLSEIISESYKVIYNVKQNSNIQKLAEAHLEDVRSNPSDIERLSRQLCNLQYLASMVESNKVKDSELLVPEEKYSKVEPEEKDEDLKESKDDEDVEEKDDEDLLDEETQHDEDVEETEDEDLLEDANLTDEEVEALTKHLTEMRKSKKSSCSESTEGRSLKKRVSESKSYDKLNLSEFNKKSSSKAFVKTFKKLDAKLHEGTALTRQESISLYKATNSAMTHLSVELEHNPDFLSTFKESVSLLSVDVNKLLGSLSEGKGPSKATMKSLAKFSEALLREAEEDEELPPIEDEEEEIVSDEEEEFDQEYAEARVELHKDMVEEHAEDEDPAVQEKLAQDAEEVAALPGVTDEQIAELTGEETTEDEAEEEAPEEEIEEETQHDEDVEKMEEDMPEEEPEEEDDSDITDDELAELKKHLTEMRKAKKVQESSKGRKLKRRA